LDGAFANKVVLAKKVPDTKLSEPLEDVIRYMCDPTPDALNEALADNPGSCYTAQEVSNASLIEEALEDGLNSENSSFEVQAVSLDGNSMVYLGKDNELRSANIASKQNDILRDENFDGEVYKLVDLKGVYVGVGGKL